MRVMILGAGGMLGHDLVVTAPSDVALFPTTRSELDITNYAAVATRVGEVGPDIIVNAAAYTAVDRAESEPALAFRVNAEATRELGRIAATARIPVVQFSTDYVFDGNNTIPYLEEDATNPLNVYGASKLAGETALAESGAKFLILRTQWLFGASGRSFPKTMWERATAGIPTKVVSDQTGRPTDTGDLARTTWGLVERRARGVLHVANRGEATWFDVANHIFSRAGRPDLIRPCTTDEHPSRARRPRYSVLDTRRVEGLVGPLPEWKRAMDVFLGNLAAPDR